MANFYENKVMDTTHFALWVNKNFPETGDNARRYLENWEMVDNRSPIVINAGNELDHAKVLILAKQLCNATENTVYVKFNCSLHIDRVLLITHRLEYSKGLQCAIVESVYIEPVAGQTITVLG